MLRSTEVRPRRENSNYVAALCEWKSLFRLGILYEIHVSLSDYDGNSR